MENYFENRRTCRKFVPDSITRAEIADMLRQAMHAPTTGNMQLYSVVVTMDPEVLAQLAPAHFSQPAMTGAPAVLTFCADFNRFEQWCRLHGAEPGYENVQSLVAAALDAAIFAQQFVTIAEMNGFGTCYLGTATYNPQKIAQVLHLPHRAVPIAAVAVGRPAAEAQDAGRLPLEAVCHWDTYKDYTEDSIRTLYAEKEAREDSRQFAAENNLPSLAHVFTDIRYTRANNEAFSDTLVAYLRQHGYL